MRRVNPEQRWWREFGFSFFPPSTPLVVADRLDGPWGWGAGCGNSGRRGGEAVLAFGMSVFHDEVEIEDFEYDEETETYSYPCPCGDRFLITREDLENGEDVATCPSCSLIVRVIYDKEQFLCGEEILAPTTSKELVKC
ncbi:hypothetical protein JRQ81_018743 [Phrynocephalus forsythii]|uniref:Diphthamide biosynthesis protein 3 n=1 Tax=Phrynocephalus forsythii TaxID=171643 RepID=A0A9Q0XSG7_9SAUR|nr:hypothetical protein JRQ81_018743 [Phrynocephalus forsythii]